MSQARKRKLYVILLMMFVIFLVVALVAYALRQNISLFYSPTQISQRESPVNKNIRVGGVVKKGSVIRKENSLDVAFDITDFAHTLKIHYRGILPDLFREGQGIVAQGILLPSGEFNAVQVLAKHDENYMPPEVRASLSEAKQREVSS